MIAARTRELIRCPDCQRKLGEWLPDGLILMRHADGSAVGVMQALGCTTRCGGVWRPFPLSGATSPLARVNFLDSGRYYAEDPPRTGTVPVSALGEGGSAMTVAVPTAPQLMSDAPEVELTDETLQDEMHWFLAHVDTTDFARGPYVYSLCIVKRGDSGAPSDPTCIYHYQLYDQQGDVKTLLRPLALPGAVLDVSLRRSSTYSAEHKTVKVVARER